VFFQLDLNRTLSRLNERPIGTITWKYRAAQRRFIDRVLWDRLRRESPVYDGDSIRTAALSEAVVGFAEGGRIDLAENTFVQIFVRDALPRIDLIEGTIDADAGEKALVLAAGEHELTIDPGGAANALKGTADAAGDAAFMIRTGRASLLSAGIRQEASAGGALFPGGSGEGGARTVMLSPPPGARLLASGPGAVTVDFEWNSVHYGPEDKTRLVIAHDRGFTRIAAALDLPGGENRAQAELVPGAYFWRAYAPDKAERDGGESPAAPPDPVSYVSKLTILHAPPPELISPAEDLQHPWRPGARPLRFRWTGPGISAAEPDYYLLEAADNPGMTNAAIQMQTRAASAEFSPPGPGRWFWRVSARYGDTFRPSRTGSFEIIRDSDLSAPVLLAPLPEGAVNIAPEGRDPYFSWRHDGGMAAYTIVISEHQDLSNPLLTERVEENYYPYPAKTGILGEGRYYWGVSAEDSRGNRSSFSPARPFTAHAAEIVLRTIFPPDNYSAAENLIQDIRFTWRANVSSPIRIQIAGEPEFAAPLVDEAVFGSAFQGRRLPPGTWYWRLAALSAERPRYSETNRLTVLGTLPPPEMEPPEGSSASGAVGERQMVVVQPGGRITFRWQAVEGAQYYVFNLYNTDRETGGMGNRVFSAPSIKDTSIGMSMDDYEEGLYYWTVRSMAGEGTSQSRLTGLTGKAQFNLRKSGRLILDYPPPGHEYPALDAQERPGELRWSFLDTPRRTRFILSASRNLSGPPLMDIADPSQSIRLKPLPPGTYYWTVRGEGLNGTDISAKPSWFRVLPMSSLGEAGNRQPADDFVFGPEQLRGRSSITFSWNEVKGANAYTFTLEQEEEGQPSRMVVHSGPGPERSYTLNDLSLLTRGRFIWKVEPAHLMPDGSFLRRGAVGENHFTVDIPAVQRRDLQDVGTLYGH
jgi:hypothetical protein